jgi:hypothetical protein
MLFSDMHRKISLGETVNGIFTDKIEELDTLFDSGCKATLMSVGNIQHYDDGSVCGEFVFDLSTDEEFNRTKYKPNYYDSKHNPCLYVWETTYYPVDKKESIWFMFDTDTDEYFTITEEK